MLYTAFLFGLLSSFHCIGMCGPIALVLPVNHSNASQKVLQILTYHSGRLLAYSTIGLLFGLLGKGFFLAGLQQKISIFVGIMMILIVIIPEKKAAQFNFSKPIFRGLSFLKQKMGAQFKNKSYRSIFTIGVLNGFLPCGMVYVALFGAMAMQSPQYGVFYMFLFGLGTVPMMSMIVYINGVLTHAVRSKIQKIIPIVAICIGVLFVLRGLGLGIPYISPKTTSLFVQQSPNCH